VSFNHCAIVNSDRVNLRVVSGVNRELKTTRTIAKDTLVRVFSFPVYDYEINGRVYEFRPISFDEGTGYSSTPEFWIASDFLSRVACPTETINQGTGPLALTLAAVYLFLLND
jgi:hypothetical protein